MPTFIFTFISLSCLFCLAAANPDVAPSNSTTPIILPVGSSNHGHPNLLCRPSRWHDVLIFFIGNYVLHAATARPLPGESAMSITIATILALLLPSSGVLRGIKAIVSGAKFSTNDLITAARAGAFCTVVREGEDGLARKVDITYAGWFATKIHGTFSLPSGFEIVHVPSNAVQPALSLHDNESTPFFRAVTTSSTLSTIKQQPIVKSPTLTENYNLLKSGVSLGQAIFACFTLYRTRGDQLSMYGYAAPGLTVAPYAIMSIVNLLGSLLCPEYPALYLVESEPMQEARKQGGIFSGTVTDLRINMQILLEDNYGASSDRNALLLHTSAIIFGFIPLLIVGLVSKLDPASSTFSQRSWLMTWLVFGAVFGPIIEWRRGELMSYGQSTWSAQLSTIGIAAFYAAPAIGGFVVVGQMIMSYGTCLQLT